MPSSLTMHLPEFQRGDSGMLLEDPVECLHAAEAALNGNSRDAVCRSYERGLRLSDAEERQVVIECHSGAALEDAGEVRRDVSGCCCGFRKAYRIAVMLLDIPEYIADSSHHLLACSGCSRRRWRCPPGSPRLPPPAGRRHGGGGCG